MNYVTALMVGLLLGVAVLLTGSDVTAAAVPVAPAAAVSPGAAAGVKRVEVAAGAAVKDESATRGESVAATSAMVEQPSVIERSILTGSSDPERVQPLAVNPAPIAQFGYGYFQVSASSYAPLTDIPVGPDYVIGPGDRIMLTLWGSVEGTHELEVNRSGEIVLPKVGTLKVWGVSFGKLREVISASLARVYRDFELNVTMGKLKLMKVFVVGEVARPGDYNLSALSTIMNALSAAGGPLKSGTLRDIRIKRDGKLVESVDLYDFFLNGDKSRDIRLLPGDTVFVPVIGRVAGVAGSVRRPAIYELKGEKTLKELLALAEGFLPTGYLQRLQIARVEAHQKKVVADFNVDPGDAQKNLDQLLAAVPVQDLDVVKVFPINDLVRDHVRLTGHVLRPGDYALRSGMHLSDLVKDNLLPEYYPNVAEVTRLLPPDSHPEVMFVDLAKALAGDPTQNLELKEFDRVKVFARNDMSEPDTVRVNGMVQRPGTYRLLANMTVRDLVLLAGNLKNSAYLDSAEITRVRRTGATITSYPVPVNLGEAMKGNPQDNLKLEPYDELGVRMIPDWVVETERYVTLQGEVRFPGVYPVYKGERLSSVVERAGGFTSKGYLRGAKFTRKSVQEDQQKRLDEIVARTEKALADKRAELASVAASREELEAAKASLDALSKGVEKLKAARAEGRVVIRLSSLDNLKAGPYDLELQGGDTLVVPLTPNHVSVMGQVYNPATLVHIAGKRLSYYLDKTGGPAADADEDGMYLLKVDGSVVSRQQVSFGLHWDEESRSLSFGSFKTIDINPGDTLVVPQRLERIAWMRDIKDIATILGQIALTAGVLVAAGL